MATTRDRVDPERLLERYRARAAVSASEVLLQHADALSLLKECADQGITVLGMDFYRRHGSSFVPLLNSADYSSLASAPDASMQTVEEARQLIHDVFPDGADFVSFVLQ